MTEAFRQGFIDCIRKMAAASFENQDQPTVSGQSGTSSHVQQNGMPAFQQGANNVANVQQGQGVFQPSYESNMSTLGSIGQNTLGAGVKDTNPFATTSSEVMERIGTVPSINYMQFK